MRAARRPPPESKQTFKDLFRRLTRGGFSKEFLQTAVLPDWWDDECRDDASLLPEVELRVARFLGTSVKELRTSTATLAPAVVQGAQLRRVSNIDRDRLHAAIHAGLRIGEAVARSLRQPSREIRLPPTDPLKWRAQLERQGSVVDLATLVADLWERGIPVVPVEFLPTPKYQGMSCIVADRPVVLIGHSIDVPARLELLIGHETAHIVRGDCERDKPVIDERQEVSDASPMEQLADEFSWTFATAGRKLPAPPDAASPKELALKAEAVASKIGVDAGVVIWSWASKQDDYQSAQLAFRALYQAGGLQILRAKFDEFVSVEEATETDRALLKCVFGDPDRALAAG